MGRLPSHHGILILASLAAISPDDERHGYAIKKDIEQRTAGDVQLGSTTLYRLLAQLLDAGLISEHAPRGSHVDPRRRCYRITVPGRRALSEETARLERVLAAARPLAGRRSS